jgi:hypothetical protein
LGCPLYELPKELLHLLALRQTIPRKLRWPPLPIRRLHRKQLLPTKAPPKGLFGRFAQSYMDDWHPAPGPDTPTPHRFTTAEGYFSQQLLNNPKANGSIGNKYGYDPVMAYIDLYFPHYVCG